MCSACRMDPRDVRFMRERQGAREPEYGEVEVNYKPKKKKAKSVSKYPGCPGNDRGPHVFVWTSEGESKTKLFYRFFGYHKHESKMCVGCGHVDKRRTSERYEREAEKRGMTGRRWRWNFWEYEHEEYSEYRKQYMKRHGWNHDVYDW